MSGCHRDRGDEGKFHGAPHDGPEVYDDQSKTEHRPKCSEPTSPGFYYARHKFDNSLRAWPRRVVMLSHGPKSWLVIKDDLQYLPLDEYDWYGPVNDVIPV